MYTKCLYKKCIPHFDKLFYTFCIQNLAAVVLLILYTKYIKKFVEMWDTFCIYFVYFLYIFCIYLVQFLYTKCIQSFRVWLEIKRFFKVTLIWSNDVNTSWGRVPNATFWMRFTCCQYLMFLASPWLDIYRFPN